MKKSCALSILFFVSVSTLFAQHADAITGIWLSKNKDAKVEIYKTLNKYAGKIIWLKQMLEEDGQTPKTDKKNADPALRNRPLLNLVILTDFIYEDGKWVNGKVYDPQSAKTYSSKMKLKGKELELRGYIGSPLFGKTTVWTRTE